MSLTLNLLTNYIGWTPEEKTVSGTLLQILDALARPAKALALAIEPAQDLHGYDSPWPAGGGKNLLDFSALTLSKCTISGTADNFTLTGTDVSYNRAELDMSGFPDGVYYVSAKAERSAATGNNAFLTAQYRLNGTTYNSGAISNTKQYNSSGISDTVDAVLQFPEGSTNRKLFFYLNNNSSGGTGVTTNITGARICRAQNEPYSPYSNICPISGWTGANIYRSGADTDDPTTYAIDWTSEAGTVYDGTLNVLTGELKSSPHYASYNGEALVGPWVSSMDAYAPGTTPTIGAEVVDLGGIVSTYQLTPQEVTLLLGENNLWASTDGELALTYYAAPE